MSTDFPKFTMKEMLEAGVHFGHKEMLWNPKMDPFIYGSRNGVHIIDLQKTVALLFKSLQILKAAGSNKKSKVLFVGTKRQASDAVKEAAKACGQYYVNHRWLGGMLTNWKTISKSIKKMEELEKILEEAKNPETVSKYNKKELLDIDRKREKMESYLGGIRDMGGKPDIIFIIDTNKEKIAIQEAKVLGIPVVAIVDTNSSLEGVDFPIPGNDDASRSIRFYCKVVAEAIMAGAQEAQMSVSAAEGIGTLGESLKEEEATKKTSAKAKKSSSEEKNDEKEVKAASKSEKEAKKDEAPKAKSKKADEDKKPAKTTAKKSDDKEDKAEKKKVVKKETKAASESKKTTAKKPAAEKPKTEAKKK